jgi:hypothetical protein
MCGFICPAASAEGSASGAYIGLIYCDLISPQPIGSSLALSSIIYIHSGPALLVSL